MVSFLSSYVGVGGSLFSSDPGVGRRWEMKLPRAVRNEIGLKIAALALAVFLWVNVAERREVEVLADLPIKYTNMPSDMTFADEVVEEAKARIRGRGKFLKWRLQNLYFAIDLSAAGKDRIVTHVVSPSEVVIPPDKEIEVLEVIEPKAIRVELDKLITRKLPPKPILTGEVPEDKIMLGKAVADPPQVVIAGAEQIVGNLAAVATEAVDLGQLAKKEGVSARVDLGGLPFVTSDVEEVTISARIESRKELGIPSVPIEPLSDRGIKAKFTPDSLDVVISGAESQVDSLDPQDLRLTVDVTNLPKGQLAFTPVVRNGSLYFEVRNVGKDRDAQQVFEIAVRLESPYRFDLVSAAPEEIGFVLR
jgi:YbbR domain-containing protein